MKTVAPKTSTGSPRSNDFHSWATVALLSNGEEALRTQIQEPIRTLLEGIVQPALIEY